MATHKYLDLKKKYDVIKRLVDENGNITASSFIGNLSGIATKAEKSYLTYNDSKVYYYNFGGAQDLNWKKVASIAYTFFTG